MAKGDEAFIVIKPSDGFTEHYVLLLVKVGNEVGNEDLASMAIK